MKRLTSFLLLALFIIAAAQAQRAKYVFYFIGLCRARRQQ